MRTALCSHIFRLLRRTRVPWVLHKTFPGLDVASRGCHLKNLRPYIVQELKVWGTAGLTALSAYRRSVCNRRRILVASSTAILNVLLSTDICKGHASTWVKCLDPRPLRGVL